MTLYDTVRSERGRIVRNIAEPFEIVRMTYSEDMFEMPPFFGMWKGQVLDSESGVAAKRGLGLVKQCHKYQPEGPDSLETILEVSSAKDDSIVHEGMLVRDVVNQTKNRVYSLMLDHQDFYQYNVNGPRAPKEQLLEADTRLKRIAREMVRDKFVRDMYRAYVVESRVKDDLEEWGYEVVATNEAISEHTEVPDGYESFESAGYDLYLPEEDTAVQVKEGKGGTPEDEADVYARLKWTEDHDVTTPRIEYDDY